MNGIQRFLIFLTPILLNQSLFATVSIVYNLRISETTKQRSLVAKQINRTALAAVTPFDQYRRKYTGTTENYLGGILTYVHMPNSWYVKGDFAVAHVHAKMSDGNRIAKRQTDDILITGGYSVLPDDKNLLTFSGLFGIPTHKDFAFEGPQFGTGHYGLGVQLDGSFAVSDDLTQAIMTAMRYVHFFKRDIVFCATPGVPTRFSFGAGNLIDLFIAYQGSFGRHRFECGYNPSALFEASVSPFLATVQEKTNFIRSSWFASYYYVLFDQTVKSSLTFGLSYGFDHQSKIYGNKNIVTGWITWAFSW